jgi:processive 1,2-diacylglycerol beta-glucosyltransferase
MERHRKVLNEYARFGDGHLQAATALRDSFTRLGIGEAQLIDLLEQSHPFLNEISKFVYRKSYSLFPQVYGWVYDTTKDMKSDTPFAHWLHSFGRAALLKLIRQEQPDAVIHTFPSLALPTLTNRIGRRIPMFNVVTDFDLHRRWVHPQVDKYYVATDDLHQELTKLGIGANQIAATGIPLRPSFSNMAHLPEREAIAERYGFASSDQPIVLLMAGAYGNLANLRKLCRRLADQRNAQIVIVCGNNRAVRSQLNKYFASHDNVTVLGYVDRVDELMRLSVCIMTKPGGLTVSEAIEAKLPIFLYRPVPGQERHNAIYLQSKGAAVVCQTTDELFHGINGLLRDVGLGNSMRSALGTLRKERAADRIALDIVQQLHIMEEASVPL